MRVPSSRRAVFGCNRIYRIDEEQVSGLGLTISRRTGNDPTITSRLESQVLLVQAKDSAVAYGGPWARHPTDGGINSEREGAWCSHGYGE